MTLSLTRVLSPTYFTFYTLVKQLAAILLGSSSSAFLPLAPPNADVGVLTSTDKTACIGENTGILWTVLQRPFIPQAVRSPLLAHSRNPHTPAVVVWYVRRSVLR